MTTKYESVLSESERNRICIQATAGKQGLQADRSVSRATEQAVLAKLQPQLDAIGAGGVSGQRVSLGGQPFRKQPTDKLSAVEQLYKVVEKELLDIEMCFENFDTPQQAINDLIEWHVSANQAPAGYKLVPIEPSAEQINAMRTGSYKDWPSDELCRVRYAAMLAAAPTPDIKDSLTTERQELRIVFRGEVPNLTFLDVENEDGFSVNVGQWHKRFDGYTELRIKTGNTE